MTKGKAYRPGPRCFGRLSRHLLERAELRGAPWSAYAIAGALTLLTVASASAAPMLAHSPVHPAVTPTWALVCNHCGPITSNLEAAAYDVADGYLVAFGGVDSKGTTGLTWEFSGGTWTAVALTPHPSARSASAMAYDNGSHKIVLFGGSLAKTGAPLGDTWTFHSGKWTNVTATAGVHPSARSAASMVYDAALKAEVLFGGSHGSTTSADTWEFKAGHWTNVTASVGTGPSPRTQPAFAFAPANGAAVLFGGWDASGCVAGCELGDTWTLNATGWHLKSISGPSARLGASAAYDPALHAIVLYGGVNSTGLLDDVWTFARSAWTPIPGIVNGTDPSGAALLGVEGSDFAWDAGDSEMVLTEGYGYLPTGYGGTGWLPTVWALK